MTNEKTIHVGFDPTLAEVHYAARLGDRPPSDTACMADASTVKVTPYWSAVTCGECRLEQPMQDVPGKVEYRTPKNVIETDRALGLLDLDASEALAEVDSSLAAVEATYVMLGQSIEYLKERRSEARAEREDLVRRRSALLRAQEAARVPEEGSGVSSPENGSQRAGEVRFRVKPGAHGEGRLATFLRPGFGRSTVCVRLDGETQERFYARRYLERVED